MHYFNVSRVTVDRTADIGLTTSASDDIHVLFRVNGGPDFTVRRFPVAESEQAATFARELAAMKPARLFDVILTAALQDGAADAAGTTADEDDAAERIEQAELDEIAADREGRIDQVLRDHPADIRVRHAGQASVDCPECLILRRAGRAVVVGYGHGYHVAMVESLGAPDDMDDRDGPEPDSAGMLRTLARGHAESVIADLVRSGVRTLELGELAGCLGTLVRAADVTPREAGEELSGLYRVVRGILAQSAAPMVDSDG